MLRRLASALMALALLAPATALAQSQGGHGHGGGGWRGGFGGEPRSFGGRGFGPGPAGEGSRGRGPQPNAGYGGPRQPGGPDLRRGPGAIPGPGPGPAYGQPQRDWRRGQYMPPAARGDTIQDFARFHLRRPPRGYYWYRSGDDYVLASTATGQIFEVIPMDGY